LPAIRPAAAAAAVPTLSCGADAERGGRRRHTVQGHSAAGGERMR
jgi:hypothetical protein